MFERFATRSWERAGAIERCRFAAILASDVLSPVDLLAAYPLCRFVRHVGATVGLLLEDRPEEWKDYTILFPTELLPSDSVIWVRKGEKETAEALDKSIRQLHTSGKLLEFAKANRLRNTDYLEQERKTLSAGK